MEDHIEPFIVPPKGAHKYTFIMLHGRGDTAKNFGPMFMLAGHSSGKSLQDLLPNMKFILPTAKKRRVSTANRCMSHQWFDIASLEDPSFQSEIQIEGLYESVTYIHSIIREEMRFVPCRNIIIGGLSQGCATALCALLTFEPATEDKKAPEEQGSCSLGAMIGMSGWLPFYGVMNDEAINTPKELTTEPNPFTPDPDPDPNFNPNPNPAPTNINKTLPLRAINSLRETLNLHPLLNPSQAQSSLQKTPIFLGHGTADEKVDFQHAEKAVDFLKTRIGMKVTWRVYDGWGHWWKVPEEIDDVVEFLQEKVLSTRTI